MTEKTEETQRAPNWTWVSLITICLLLAISGGIKNCSKKKAIESSRSSSSAPQQMVEALVEKNTCFTPCSSFVGWSYKVRTNGDPVRVSTQRYSWELKDKLGITPPPKEFEPGEAEIVSLNEKNPHVKVWVYEKVKIPAP